ncbi:hypothetical protein [Streptomyces anandii]|uniref:hypothetical protein n=1 Tax=Streptomyces anandii TaxID=285454 RepID=UPI0036740924
MVKPLPYGTPSRPVGHTGPGRKDIPGVLLLAADTLLLVFGVVKPSSRAAATPSSAGRTPRP